jgi:ribonucleotide monophosphatase NagD (HAD superfamily)
MLDVGAFVLVLEFASGKYATVIGKPNYIIDSIADFPEANSSTQTQKHPHLTCIHRMTSNNGFYA